MKKKILKIHCYWLEKCYHLDRDCLKQILLMYDRVCRTLYILNLDFLVWILLGKLIWRRGKICNHVRSPDLTPLDSDCRLILISTELSLCDLEELKKTEEEIRSSPTEAHNNASRA